MKFLQDSKAFKAMVKDMDQESKNFMMIDENNKDLDDMETYIIENEGQKIGFCGILDAGSNHAELPIYIKEKFRKVWIAVAAVRFQEKIARLRGYTHTAHSTYPDNARMKALSFICGYKFWKSIGPFDVFVRPLGG